MVYRWGETMATVNLAGSEITGRDTKMVVKRPPQTTMLAIRFNDFPDTVRHLAILLRSTFGNFSIDEQDPIVENAVGRATAWTNG